MIAAVGLVNLLTIGVVQRRRELGLLRALGVSNGQVRGMVLLEAAHITIAAIVDRARARRRLRLGGRAVAARVGADAPRPRRSRDLRLPRRCRCWPVVVIVARDRGADPRRRGRARRGSRRASPRSRRSPSEAGGQADGAGAAGCRGQASACGIRAARGRAVRGSGSCAQRRGERADAGGAPLPRSPTAPATARARSRPPMTSRSRQRVLVGSPGRGRDRHLVVPDVEARERPGQRDAAVAEDPHRARSGSST